MFSEVRANDCVGARPPGGIALRAPPGCGPTSNESQSSDQTLLDASGQAIMFDAPPAPAAACAGARGAGCAANNTVHPLTCTQGAGGDAGAGFDSGETNASDLSNSASGANNAAAHRSSGANAQPRGGNTGGGSGGHRHARPSGYRRLWAAVCGPDGAPGGDRGGGGAFGHRGGSDPGAAAASWRDVSVEELIRGVQALPASAPAGDAVRAGLAYLDSRAFAALLKGLSKAGLGNRAMELFDDVRRVPLDNNPCTGSRCADEAGAGRPAARGRRLASLTGAPHAS
jgi:hypothetical protein